MSDHELAEYLRDQTYRLEDLCLAFRRRWAQQNQRQWELVSVEAIDVIANIAEKMLPPARARMTTASHAARTNYTALDRDTSLWVSPVSETAQIEQTFSLAVGSAVLPEAPAKVDISLLETLECLSRMSPPRVNFRLEDGRHVVLFGIDGPGVPPPGILEMDMDRFCELLQVGIDEL